MLAHNEDDTIEFNVYMDSLPLPFVEGQILDPRIFWRSASDHRALIFHEHFIGRDGAGNPRPDFDGTVLFTLFGGPGYDPTTGLGGVGELPPDIEYEVLDHPASPKVLFQPSRVTDVGIAGVDSDDKGLFQFGDWVYIYMIINDSGSTTADDPPSGWRAETESYFPIPQDMLFFRYGEGYPTDGRPYDPLLPGTTISAIGDVEGTGLNPSPVEENFSTSFTGGGWRVDFILVVNGELEDMHIAIPGGKPYYSNLLYVTSPFGPETTENSHIATGRFGGEITYTPSTWPTIQCRHFKDVTTGLNYATLRPGESVDVELKICNISHPDVNPDLQSPFRTLPAAGNVGMIKLPDDPCLIVSKSFDPPIPFYVDNHDPSPPDDGYPLGDTCHTETFTITAVSPCPETVVFTPDIRIDPPLDRNPPFNDPFGDPFYFTTLGVNEDCTFTIFLDPITTRFGNVNAGNGEVTNVLFVNGSPGDVDRVYLTSTDTYATLTMDAPPVPHPNFPGKFALYLITYEPGIPDVAVQPYSIGTSCMPMPLSKGNPKPPPDTIVNNIGYNSVLGKPILSGIPPAPCTIFDVRSLPLGTYTMQGYIFDGGSAGKGVSLTNAIVLKVQ